MRTLISRYPSRAAGLPVGTPGVARGASPSAQFALALAAALSRKPVGVLRSASPVGPRPGGPSASGGTGAAAPFDGLIRDVAKRQGVDEQLVKAVVEAESSFRPGAVSRAGAMGLMQLMPGTARSLGVKDPYDPASNVEGGVKFLKSMLDRFGSVPLALAAYNAGPGAVEKYGGIPPYRETNVYVNRVMQLQHRNQVEAMARSDQGGNDGRTNVA